MAAFLTVFALAKAKIILLNRWFVDEKRSTIGVDLSAYQADVDMGALKAQGVAFAYIKATEGSSRQNPEERKNAEDAKLLSGADRFFSQPGRDAGGELHRRLWEIKKRHLGAHWAGGAFFCGSARPFTVLSLCALIRFRSLRAHPPHGQGGTDFRLLTDPKRAVRREERHRR